PVTSPLRRTVASAPLPDSGRGFSRFRPSGRSRRRCALGGVSAVPERGALRAQRPPLRSGSGVLRLSIALPLVPSGLVYRPRAPDDGLRGGGLPHDPRDRHRTAHRSYGKFRTPASRGPLGDTGGLKSLGLPTRRIRTALLPTRRRVR